MAWTAPVAPSTGTPITVTYATTNMVNNLKAIGDPWTAYTPTWTSTGTAPAIGNGTIAGAYILAGKLVHFRLKITLGTTSTVGTGTYAFGLPVAAIAASEDALAVVGAAINAGTSWVPVSGRRSTAGASSVELIYLSAFAVGSLVSPTAPHVPGNLDIYTASGTYEAA